MAEPRVMGSGDPFLSCCAVAVIVVVVAVVVFVVVPVVGVVSVVIDVFVDVVLVVVCGGSTIAPLVLQKYL